ncbi:hypothetical protein [Ferdinandcohnia sp. Marseille-Q9671]
MNKYDEKVIQYAPQDTVIYELIRKKKHDTGGQIVNFLLEGILSAGTAVKQLQTGGAYYLLMNDKKAELVTVQRNLDLSQQDVSRFVGRSSGKKHFHYEGYTYKLFRKVTR